MIFQEQGELLFTHFGMSGPLVLSASAHMRDFEKDQYTCVIDLKPALDEEKLDQRLFAGAGGKRQPGHAQPTGGFGASAVGAGAAGANPDPTGPEGP